MSLHGTTDAEMVVQFGRLMFGNYWKGETAKFLELSPKEIRKIAAAAEKGEDYPVNARVLAKIVTGLIIREQSQKELQNQTHRNFLAKHTAPKSQDSSDTVQGDQPNLDATGKIDQAPHPEDSTQDAKSS